MKRVLIGAVRFYQKNISPLKPSCCRFIPTCSEYAATAINRYGSLKGTVMAARRIARCNPLCEGGYDPVPEGPETELKKG